MTVPVESAFLIFGGILVIGYFGDLISKRFAIPSALLLLIIGYLLKSSAYVDVTAVSGIQDLFGTLALIVLLFDGGLSLNLYDVVYKSGRVVLVSVLTTVLSIIGAAIFFSLIGSDPMIGAILGAIAGGIGSTTTISIAKGLPIPKGIKDFLTLEASITDIFSIILTIVFTQTLLSGALDIRVIGQGIVSRFSVGVFLGLVSGIASIIALTKIEKGYNYMLTFALVLILYSLTEFLSGSGAIGVLVFGLVFGNESAIRRIFRLDPSEKRPLLKQFQVEISFFIRTFFFVFLGVIVTIGSITNFLMAFGIVLLFYLVRYVSVRASVLKSPLAPYRSILTTISPRGVATAVLATYPVTVLRDALARNPDIYLYTLAPRLDALLEIAFYIIVLSIVFTTVLVPIAVHRNNSKKKNGDKHGTG